MNQLVKNHLNHAGFAKSQAGLFPRARKKSRVLDTFLRLLNNEQQPLMTVATAFLLLLVPVAAWIEDEDSIKKEEFGNFWDEGFLLILCFFSLLSWELLNCSISPRKRHI